jgi:cell wall-associated NlpC family hydrolase
MALIELDEVFGVDLGDRSVWAKSLVAGKRRLKKSAPKEVDLETAMTNIKMSDTIKGSSTIVLSFIDPDWELVDSGFFDANRDGRLDAIDVNYPEDSELWWRVTAVSIDDSQSGGGAAIEMTFMERPAAYLMQHRGPLKVSRAKRTRAEFLKLLSDHVKANGGITFHSAELHEKQDQAKLTKAEKKAEADRKKNKDKGIATTEQITFTNWDGSSYTLKPGELRNAERVLDEASKHTDSDRPLLAVLAACIVEGPMFRNPIGGDASSVGILQLLDIHTGVVSGAGHVDTPGVTGPTADKRRDIAWVVQQFMTKGFTGRGGAVDLAKANPGWTVGQIAQAVQGSAYPDRYQKVEAGAKKVLDAYGGGKGGGGEYRQQYNFEVGSTENPRENFWDASNRLADEVKWAYFLDGSDLYYDAETTLILQKPVAIIQRGMPEVVSFNANWDQRQIATEATLVLLCDPFEFRAGEVFKIMGYGPASTGSTADLPGRWLIESIDRGRFELTSTFTLKQPEEPTPEPRSMMAERAEDASSGSPSELRAKIVEVAKASETSKTGFSRYSQSGALTADPTPAEPNRTDCSQWVRAVYLKAGAGDPGSNTWEMGSKGTRTTKPKPGDLMLTADQGHVELYVGDGKTIGHGSPPIDGGEVSYVPGHFFVTFDFLEPGLTKPGGAASYSKGARPG